MASATPSSNQKLRRYLIARHGETNFNKERRVQGTNDTSRLTLDGISQASSLGVYIARRQAGETSDNILDDGHAAAPFSTNNRAATSAPPIARTWCSPLTRCRQTYAAISGCCSSYIKTNSINNNSSKHMPVLPAPTIHNDLREIELCEWQGRLRQEIIEQEKDNWEIFKANPKLLTLKQGTFSPVVDCWERGLSNWNAIRSDAVLKDTSISGSSTTNTDMTDKEEQQDTIFIMAHGAIGQCMLLQSIGIPIELYGKSRKYSFDNCECIEIEWADGEETSVRWRRVHSEISTQWQSSVASRAMATGLSSGRTADMRKGPVVADAPP